MTRFSSSIGRDYFEALYAADPDPWDFAGSDYEREKYAASLDALPHASYAQGLEVGCSIGIFTRLLAARCERLLALDVADTALAQARKTCTADNVVFENRSIPRDFPDGRFDLIVLSEVLYYLDKAELTQAALLVRSALAPEGVALLVHYLGETNYPLSGDEAAECFIAASGLCGLRHIRTDAYRIDVLKT